MNATTRLDTMPIWALFLVLLVAILLAIEIGFRLGERTRKGSAADADLSAGPFVGASLSLLAFMLAMVFTASMSRLQEMKEVGLRGANAIGRVHLYADLVPGEDRAEIQQLLREYASLTLEANESGDEQSERALERSDYLRRQLWSRATALAEQSPSLSTARLLDSVLRLFDVHNEWITLTVHYRLPGIVWVALFGLAVLAMATAGYARGLAGSRQTTIALWAAVGFSVVLVLVVALERPRSHLSRVARSALLDLQEDFKGPIDPGR